MDIFKQWSRALWVSIALMLIGVSVYEEFIAEPRSADVDQRLSAKDSSE